MNTRPLCPYCDGENIRSRLVQFEWASDGGVIITEGDSARVVAPGAFSISDPIGSIPRFLRIAAGGVIELPTAFDVSAATGGNGLPGISAAVHWLESRTAVAAVALVLVTLLVGLGVWQGAPRLARRIAFAVPVAIEQRAGDAAYQVFRQSFAPTSLKPTEQRHVQAQLDRLMAARAPHVTPRLVFLQMRSPNAFALPGGIIVVADELVELAKTDDELAAVLAHEMGHVERRHGLQSVLRNSAALLVVSTVTGDLSTLGTFSATLPFLLLQYGYAREFEAEADEYAAALLVEARINPENLARVLNALEDTRSKQTGTDFSYLSTHPSTADRTRILIQAGARSRLPTPEQHAASIAALAAIKSAESDRDKKALAASKKALEVNAADSTRINDTPPRGIFMPQPEYPSALRKAGVTGDALIEFTVTTDGTVVGAKVMKATNALFAEAALAAVSQWRFTPAKLNGKPVNRVMQQPITFSLAAELHYLRNR